MGLEPIRVELNDFAKLELLREEEERLGGELADVERQIREISLAAVRREYLMSLSAYYATQEAQGAGPDAAAQLETRRALIAQALETVSAQRKQYEDALGAPAAGRGSRGARRAAGASGAAKRSRFDSFDDFKQNQAPGAGPNQTQG